MRIAIITPFYRPSIGGVEYIAYHIARELVRRGYEVHIIMASTIITERKYQISVLRSRNTSLFIT